MELKEFKTKHFKNCYVGNNSGKYIVCILDDYCVRYIVDDYDKNGHHRIRKHEFSNDKKELCFKNATKALNK